MVTTDCYSGFTMEILPYEATLVNLEDIYTQDKHCMIPLI